MKKLMIAAAIVCAAVASQAATFNWSTSAKVLGVKVADVTDNGNYTSTGGSALKGNSTLTYTLTLYAAGTSTEVGTQTGTVAFNNMSGKVQTTITVAAAEGETTYDYVLAITGSQNDLRAKTSDTYDYSAAVIASSQNGSVTTLKTGNTTLSTAIPSSWTVSGITKEEPGPEPTPEPTSAMLMLLGVASLALKRKRA